MLRVGNTNNNGLTIDPLNSAIYDFDPLNELFGFYSEWPFFNDRRIFSENSLNDFQGKKFKII